MARLQWRNHSLAYGALPRGCVLCTKGAKLVLLVTGLCGASCFYCPLSLKKKGKDVVYANERPVEPDDFPAILEEANLIDSMGTGLTGGDPLSVPDRTVRYIEALKSAFGERHHIHLYTATACDERYLERLYTAGLDEIRFHPPPETWRRLERSQFREAIRLSIDTGLNTGVEIPAIPGTKNDILTLLDSITALDVDFLNLNEFEYSETNWEALRSMGFIWRSETSNAIKGSERVAVQIVNRASDLDLGMSVHYCSSAFKDGVQLRNRLKRRAKNVANAYDIMTDDGTLIRGIIETSDPEGLREHIMEVYGVPNDLIAVRDRRIEIASWVLEEISPDLEEEAYLIEIYPTYDALEVERTPL